MFHHAPLQISRDALTIHPARNSRDNHRLKIVLDQHATAITGANRDQSDIRFPTFTHPPRLPNRMSFDRQAAGWILPNRSDNILTTARTYRRIFHKTAQLRIAKNLKVRWNCSNPLPGFYRPHRFCRVDLQKVVDACPSLPVRVCRAPADDNHRQRQDRNH
jgi:hypothetical protein